MFRPILDKLYKPRISGWLAGWLSSLKASRRRRQVARRQAACPHRNLHWVSRPYPTRATAMHPADNVALAGQADVRWTCDDCGTTGQDMQPCDHPQHVLEWRTRGGRVDGPVTRTPTR